MTGPLHRIPLDGPVDLTGLQRSQPARYPLLLQSIAGGNALSRWDVLFIANGEGLQCRNGQTSTLAGEFTDLPFLEALDALYAAQGHRQASDLPFTGGWALYLGYELSGQIEPSLILPAFDGPLPDALALRCPAAVLFDKIEGNVIAVAEHGYESLLEDVQRHAEELCRLPPVPAWQAQGVCTEDDPAKFIDAVNRIHGYLNAGDVFQVNISRAWNGHYPQADAHALYARLCQLNPSPFAGILQFDSWSLLSSSPERLVSVNGDSVQTRPIAGTRPRIPGDDDAGRIAELIGHPKERAEHVMLIDLERNDLSRVCEAGSIRVDELMQIETYAHVHHIVSNVSGKLKPGVLPGKIIAAVFPGGTITGCPKVRCMQIIAELEGEGRGPYTGALGYLNGNGRMDLNILIRSLWLEGDHIQLRAGGGIVADSEPQRELQETRAKAKGLLKALETSL